MKRLRYDGSYTGFCAALAEAFREEGTVEILASRAENLLFTGSDESIHTIDDAEQARGFRDRLRQELGGRAASALRHAFCAEEEGREGILLEALGIWFQYGRRVVEARQYPAVAALQRMAGRTGREKHRYLGILRFEETDGGLFGRIRPDCDQVELLAPHFRRRYPADRWTIYDERRKKGVSASPGGTARLFTGPPMRGTVADGEYAALWKEYVEAVAVKERTNSRQQNSYLPKKYRPLLPEFD